MTYPPGGPGYPPQPQPNPYNAPSPQYGRAPERIPAAPAAPAAPSNLPKLLTAAVSVLGLLVFGFSFADPFGLADSYSGGVPRELMSQLAGQRGILTFLPAIAAVAASLLAGVDLLPKQKNLKAWTAILSVLGLLLAIVEIAQVKDGVEIKWGLYCVLAFSVLQAGAAVAALLLDAGVIQPPAPKPQVDPYAYGAPGQYYGQPPLGGPQQAPQHTQQPPQVRPDYGQQYGQPGGYPQPGPLSGGYPTGRPQQAPTDESSPVTPATGFAAFGQTPNSAPSAGPESGYPGASGVSDATQSFHQQQAPQQSDSASS
ncbi:MAG: DUF5336 domain-containing protein [Mycobacterium sp.]